jgi:ABC-type dipeptide/oligopeptide/nickel transport system permease subunit
MVWLGQLIVFEGWIDLIVLTIVDFISSLPQFIWD